MRAPDPLSPIRPLPLSVLRLDVCRVRSRRLAFCLRALSPSLAARHKRAPFICGDGDLTKMMIFDVSYTKRTFRVRSVLYFP